MMTQIAFSADELVDRLLSLPPDRRVMLLDSGGRSELGSHLLIAGLDPIDQREFSSNDPNEILAELDKAIADKNCASVFTISYEFGEKILGIGSVRPRGQEPDVCLSVFDVLVIHDYGSGETRLAGRSDKFESVIRSLENALPTPLMETPEERLTCSSNFSKPDYIAAIEKIQELIRRGETYQTNLTQQIAVALPPDHRAADVFRRLRRDHPASFSAFIQRFDSVVLSASPERFFAVDLAAQKITTSPIKGTRPRGRSDAEDKELSNDLLSSGKDRAENTMIVDLLRNDLGRVCEYGSVRVEKLCELEEHPTLFHLVSTVAGKLRPETKLSELLRALFPCGSITGAPKISTMKIIREVEPDNRGLSMGAIGYFVPEGVFGLPERLDLSVAIRTLVARDSIATFNVGGGIVIDSDPESEYRESLTKAKALLAALGATLTN